MANTTNIVERYKIWQEQRREGIRNLQNRYPVNRPLSEQEIRDHLSPDKRTRSNPKHQLSVIRMNSTYLECVDKFFEEKGGGSTIAILFIVVASVFLIAITPDWLLEALEGDLEAALALLVMYAVGLPFIWLMWFLLSFEAFRLTHYPIRFNRKTRMVHWFRIDDKTGDGAVQSEPWEKLYFTLRKIDELSPIASWEVVAHRLSEDGKTVLETFGLPYTNTYDVRDRDPFIWSQWEFVRRYMEEPEELGALADQVEFVMDIADRRETYWGGVLRYYGISGAAFLFPLFIIYGIGRQISLLTCKIPQWPAEIEASCQVEPNDPHLRDRDHLAPPPENP
jgi:hypothetical protein